MYGIVIEGVRYMIEDHFGVETWTLVLEVAKLTNPTFSTHDRYSEKVIPNILASLAEITGQTPEEVTILAGRYFVRFMANYGYAQLLKVVGRRFSDFLKGLDEMHAYFRFSYPRIRPPSFYCDRENQDGLMLHYRTRRKGYINYVVGILNEVAEMFFQQKITIEQHKQEEKKGFVYVLMKVSFDNKDFLKDHLFRERNTSLNEFLPVDAVSVLTMFPYFIAFNKKMQIVVVGGALMIIMPALQNKKINEQFTLRRPVVKFTWDACLHHLNNLFELQTSNRVQKKISNASIGIAVNDRIEDKVKVHTNAEHNQDENQMEPEEDDEMVTSVGAFIHLRGPMIYLKQSEIIVYLPSVMIDTLDNLFDVGLYLNDYSVSDCNREIIMASVQRSDDLKELLKTEKEKSRTLARNLQEIDQARKKAKELLSTMMPPEVATELLASNKKTLNICESFESVTLAFAKVMHFNELTNKLPPMEVVNFLNNIYSTFDDVVKTHGVYKVETVGECYMVSCGVPYDTSHHAEYIADATLDMIEAVKSISETILPGSVVCVKIGCHTGPVVGGVVGLRAPRYCLFGDTVNCASRLESHNKEPMTVQVSVKTKVTLESMAPGQFAFESKGKVTLKGKGDMLAFACLSKKGPPRYKEHPLQTAAQLEEIENREGVYTPIDDHNEHTHASSLSRMSISMSGGSRASSQNSPRDPDGSRRRDSAGTIDNVTPIATDDEGHSPAVKEKEKLVKNGKSPAKEKQTKSVETAALPAVKEKPTEKIKEKSPKPAKTVDKVIGPVATDLPSGKMQLGVTAAEQNGLENPPHAVAQNGLSVDKGEAITVQPQSDTKTDKGKPAAKILTDDKAKKASVADKVEAHKKLADEKLPVKNEDIVDKNRKQPPKRSAQDIEKEKQALKEAALGIADKEKHSLNKSTGDKADKDKQPPKRPSETKVDEDHSPQKLAEDKADKDKHISKKIVEEKTDKDSVQRDKQLPKRPNDTKLDEEKHLPPKPVEDKAVPKKKVEDKPIPKKTVEDKTVPKKTAEDRAVSKKAVEDKTVPKKTVEDKADKESPKRPSEKQPEKEKQIPKRPAEDKQIPKKPVEMKNEKEEKLKKEKEEPKKPAEIKTAEKPKEETPTRKVGTLDTSQQNGSIGPLPKNDKMTTAKPSSKQVAKDAKELTKNNVISRQDPIKPLDKNPLPPIDKTAITEEELDAILKQKDEKITMVGNGLLLAEAMTDESVQRECICGSFVDRQKMKTKVCSIM